MIDRLNIEVSKLSLPADSLKSSLFRKSGPSRQKVTTRGTLSIFRKSKEPDDLVTKDLLPFLRIEQSSSIALF